MRLLTTLEMTSRGFVLVFYDLILEMPSIKPGWDVFPPIQAIGALLVQPKFLVANHLGYGVAMRAEALPVCVLLAAGLEVRGGDRLRLGGAFLPQENR